MEYQELCKSMDAYIKDSSYIELLTDAGTIECIPLSLSKTLLSYRRFHDFREDGIEIIKIEHLLSVNFDEVCSFFGESARKYTTPIPINSGNISIVDIHSLLQSFVEMDDIVTVEFTDHSLYAGKIITVKGESFEMSCFNALGVWDSIESEPINEIYVIAYDNLYLHVFKKYFEDMGKSEVVE